MNGRLTQLQVTDFRSIRGTIDVPLDAPVVLVHGPNGSGKTSLLSAIELSLTGTVGSLRRFDSDYVKNLVHYDAHSSSVVISAEHDDVQAKPAKIIISEGVIEGQHLLSDPQKQFFTERAFLAQATLSRLLEIYEASDARQTASPLTRFVNDLLGLDQLDALVDGLKPSRDKRLLVKSLPLYGQVDQMMSEHEDELTRVQDSLGRARGEGEQLASEALDAIAKFDVKSIDDLDAERSQLGDHDMETNESVALAALKRDVEATLAVWKRVGYDNSSGETSEAERLLSECRVAFGVWSEAARPALEKELEAAKQLYADLPPPSRVGWSEAHTEALRLLKKESETVAARLERDQQISIELEQVRKSLNKALDRDARLVDQLSRLAAESGDLAHALSEIAPHIDDEVCPVCQRDFTEVSQTTLRDHLTTHIAALSQTASRLSALTSERQSLRTEISGLRKEHGVLEDRKLDDAEATALRTRKSSLEDLLLKLGELIEAAERGDALEKDIEDATERLSNLRRDSEVRIGIRQSLLEFQERLSLQPPREEVGIDSLFAQCLSAVEQRLSELSQRAQYRKAAIQILDQLTTARERIEELSSKLNGIQEKLDRVKKAIRDANDIRSGLRQLSERAIEARTSIVRDVFNESLNKIWNNLFIRLAPEEPFPPEFELPEEGKGPVEAKLTTRYRGGDRGGNPKAMLSSGNLNTAALTLFLSLHLSVKPLLPWLVIDDPVQSMDEIHIAQFAALLRTLSKQRGRQLIIAVHERPLFDYLALELSPASPSDKLITVELSKDSDGRTICDPRPINWNPEFVFQEEAG